MKYNGVIQRKIERIAENTRKLRSILPVSSPRLVSDFFLRSGIERTLQVSVEAMIDVANRICSLENQPPASDSYQSRFVRWRSWVLLRSLSVIVT